MTPALVGSFLGAPLLPGGQLVAVSPLIPTGDRTVQVCRLHTPGDQRNGPVPPVPSEAVSVRTRMYSFFLRDPLIRRSPPSKDPLMILLPKHQPTEQRAFPSSKFSIRRATHAAVIWTSSVVFSNFPSLCRCSPGARGRESRNDGLITQLLFIIGAPLLSESSIKK